MVLLICWSNPWAFPKSTIPAVSLSSRAALHYRDSLVRYLFKRMLKAAGLPDVRFHDLRHGAATVLLAVGVPLKVVSELLGHSSVAITADIYAHVLPEMQQEVVRKMDDLYGGL